MITKVFWRGICGSGIAAKILRVQYVFTHLLCDPTITFFGPHRPPYRYSKGAPELMVYIAQIHLSDSHCSYLTHRDDKRPYIPSHTPDYPLDSCSRAWRVIDAFVETQTRTCFHFELATATARLESDNWRDIGSPTSSN